MWRRRRQLTAPECAALARSPEGSAPLRHPLSLPRGGGGGNRGLHPTHGTRRHRRAPGQQRKISDFFGVLKSPPAGGAGMPRSRGIKEQPLDPFSPGAPASFSQPYPSLPPPRAHSRKRAIPKAEQELWEEPEEKIPELGGIQQEWEELEVEPLPDPHFGLLGTRSWQVPQGSMQDLPPEILRNIFAFLPVVDLYQNLSLVCRCWREIIRDPRFIPWKKLYQQFLRREPSALLRVEQILQEFSIPQGQQGCVLGLLRLVASTGARLDPSRLLQLLATHPLFPKAHFCVLSKFPDLLSKPGAEKMWATFAVMVLFSDGVGDIQRLLQCFQSPCSELALLEVTEVLHCMATLLLAMRNRSIPISHRLHYNIFYCLYLMENASGIVQPLQEGRMDSCPSGRADVRLTHEQQRILSHKIEPGQTVKIMAFAGTGKTSTLVKYAEKFSELKFLYLAFNKAVAEKGKMVFPRNVTCKTFHSLAFGSVGRHYKEKGKLNFSKMSVYSISFLLRNREGQSLFVRGKTVSQTLGNFFSSSDEEISEEHVPLRFKNTHGNMEQVSPQEKRINVEEAREIWHNMKKLDGDVEKKYKMTCDGYLKLWQLSKPQLLGYDAIFVDEAQDCTPAIVDIVQSQNCGKILVGDPHQQIYTFRGAVNTLYLVPHTHVYYLTQSFRFGPEIAYVGATILDVCKGIRSKTLLGGRQRGDVRGARQGKMALLSRSNWNVFEDAVEFSGRDPPAKIHVIGGLERFGLSKIYDIWKLSLPADVRKNSHLEIEDPFIRRWADAEGLPGLREYAARVEDRELEVKISIVDKHREHIPELVSRIRDNHVAQEGLADFLIGTVHQAKGLEFDTVCVADDFVQIPSVTEAFPRRMNIYLDRTPEDEWNLLYVAVTRARRCLLMSKSLENLLSLAGERFLRVELLSEAGQDKAGAAVACCVPGCTNSLEVTSGLLVKKLPLTHHQPLLMAVSGMGSHQVDPERATAARIQEDSFARLAPGCSSAPWLPSPLSQPSSRSPSSSSRALQLPRAILDWDRSSWHIPAPKSSGCWSRISAQLQNQVDIGGGFQPSFKFQVDVGAGCSQLQIPGGF
ncbi:F-box DNA helicase 1 isoform X4 [Zonotrichia albicollis]|uniref:F-box DNA helicase 1 isoform X4 n=1 Tax=Zonotrichia albicollis TaxID=44394 RepID=UPI003D8123CF